MNRCESQEEIDFDALDNLFVSFDSPSNADVTSEALSLIDRGFDVIPLMPRTKRPSATGWAEAAAHTARSFQAALAPGGNLGLRTGRPVAGGYLHVVDFDVDRPDAEAEAMAALHELVPGDVLPTCPAVISGGISGARRHYWILSDERLTKMARRGPWGKVELLGLGQQVVLPPSVHPDSGRAYRWERPPAATGPVAPLIPAARIRAWGAAGRPEATVERAREWDAERVASALATIPPAEDRDSWALKVGAALHHGSAGGDEGLRLWLEWSARTDYWREQPAKAEKEARRLWQRGFRRQGGPLATLGTLYHLADANGWQDPRHQVDLDDLDDLSDVDDLDDMDQLLLPAAPPTVTSPEDWTIPAFDDEGEPDLSHDELALDLGRAGWNRDARYCAPLGGWLLWRGQHWEAEPGMRPMAITRGFVRTKARLLLEWAERRAEKLVPAEGDKLLAKVKVQAKALRQDTTIAAVERLARSNVQSLATADQWDADDFLLGTPGGTVDLRTGELRDARRADYITKRTSVAPAPAGARPEAWLRFLGEVFPGDPEMIGFMQRLTGYALTGSTREHRLFVFHGSGRNGKGTMLATLQTIMGDYAKGIPTSTLLEARSPQHASPLARLRGARFVRGAELPVGQVWNESLVKQLTGGDSITANLMRQDAFDFVPKFTLIVDGNTKPRIRTTDVAMRARMTLAPFTASFAGREDRELPERLKAEAPAILRWAIEGAVAWQRDGLGIPASVDAASREYLDSEDSLQHFLEDETLPAPGNRVPAAALYARYRGWAVDQGLTPATQRAFGGMLSERGIERINSNGVRGFVGLALQDPMGES